ncbi:hypothetical protein ES703_05043 [subsurface metagenome]
MRTEGFRGVLLSTLVIASLMVPAISLLSVGPSSAAPDGLTPHAPIYIISNDNFIPANGVVGGSGTENDPYIIENYSINAENVEGIDIRNTTDYFIIRNCLVENGVDNYNGIHLENVVNGRVESCIFRNNFNGIHVSYSSHTSISYNTCESNYDDGIHVRDYSSYISITHNTCENNPSDGIQLSDSSHSSILHNICENNHDSGIHLLSYSFNNTVDNNVCVNRIYGIHLMDSDNNVLSSNILGNNVFGVRLKGSDNNVLEYNICENNSWGIYLRFSSDNNTVHHNCLLFNTENNGYDGDTNTWDDGSEGNRWSDWQPPEHPDADGDGIVDEPRPIMAGINQDWYPIVFGVRVTISPSENIAEPCTTLEYVAKLVNLNYVDDNFDLTWVDTENWGDNIWLGDNSLWIRRCGSEKTTTLYVHIPYGVKGCSEDNITIFVTSQSDNTVMDNFSCVAHVAVVKDVEVSISPEYQSAEPSNVLDYTVTVRNTGNVDDVYDLSWDDNAGWGDNIWLGDNSLSAKFGGENSTTLHVHIPGSVEGGTEDNIIVTAISQFDNTVSDNDSCIANVPIVHQVEVSILPEEISALPAENLTYTVTVTNTGTVSNTFDLTVIDNENWGPTLDNSSLSIPFGENQTTTLRVHIPENAIGSTRDNITVTATGTEVENSASCIAHVTIVRGVEVSISPDYQEGLPGETLEYEVTVTSTGTVDDTYDLSVIDTMNWGPTLSENSLRVPAGGENTTTLSVTIPEKTFAGKKDNITVTASGTGVENENNAIASVGVVRGVDVEISPSYKENLSGENLVYIVTVTNTGNVGDNYDLSVSQTKNWEVIFWFTFLNLPPYSSAQSELIVIIPENAIPGTQDNITVTAVSQTDNTVTDSDSCIAQAKIIREVKVSIVEPSYQENENGGTLTYTVTVANIGNVLDSYALENIDTIGWGLSLSESLLENIENGASVNVTLTVAIPDDAIGRTLDNITVIATSQENENVLDSGSCLASVRVVVGIYVRIEPDWQRYFVGENLSYAVTVVNTGNVPDNYTLTVEDNADWGPWLSENRLENLWPGENKPATLRVTIPENATPGTEDNIVVEATSEENANVSETASCIAHATVPKVEFTFLTLYKIRLDVDILVENGSKLVAKFYRYDNTTFRGESVIDVFVPPKHVENIETIPHPLGLPVEIVTLFLTTDNTEEEFYTVASFVVRKVDLEARFMEIPMYWAGAPPEGKVELEMEFMEIPMQWAAAPS